jgi:hypothetical protein
VGGTGALGHYNHCNGSFRRAQVQDIHLPLRASLTSTCGSPFHFARPLPAPICAESTQRGGQSFGAVMPWCNFRHTRTFGPWLIVLTRLIIIYAPLNQLDGRKRLQDVAIMQKYLTSGIEVQVRPRPAGSDGSIPPGRQAAKSLDPYSLLLAPGLLTGLFAYIIYPPLDAGPLVAFGLCIFLLPFALKLSSMVRKRLSEDVGRMRTVYICASFALLVLSLMVLVNGWQDKSPRSAVRATVIQKTSTRTKGGTSYSVVVSSWRPGRSVEELRVGARTYNNAVVGKPVTVGVHKGAFGLPWYEYVSSK